MLIIFLVSAEDPSQRGQGNETPRARAQVPVVLYARDDALYLLGIGDEKLLRPKGSRVLSYTLSPDGNFAAVIDTSGLQVMSLPDGKSRLDLPFEINSALSELVGGPVFSGDSRRVTVTIPAQPGVDSSDPAGPTGGPAGVHTFVHQLTLDGSPPAPPIPIPTSRSQDLTMAVSRTGGYIAALGSSRFDSQVSLDLFDLIEAKVHSVRKEILPYSVPVMAASEKEAYIGALTLSRPYSLTPGRADIWAVDISGRKARRITRYDSSSALRPLAVTRSGRLIYTITGEEAGTTEVRSMSLRGGEKSGLGVHSTRNLLRLSRKDSLFQAALSPDESRLLYVVCHPAEDSPCEAAVKNVVTGEQLRLGAIPSQAGSVGYLEPPAVAWRDPSAPVAPAPQASQAPATPPVSAPVSPSASPAPDHSGGGTH